MFLFHYASMSALEGSVFPAGIAAAALRLPSQLQQALGIDVMPVESVRGLLAVLSAHPLVLLALMALPLAVCSGLIAGDVERRTVAPLLVRRVRRWWIVASCALVVALWLAVGEAAGLAGLLAGARKAGVADLPPLGLLLRLVGMRLLLALAVTGIALVFSASANDRSEAVAWCMVVVLIMYVWNYLALFWPAAQPVSRWMLFRHFDPKFVLMHGAPEPQSALALACVSAAGLLVAAAVFTRRDFRM
jgi:ABC-type transport system involved in multi-copper enzyme maturation permease subunit